MTKEEKAIFDAAVQEKVASIMATQQKQNSKMLEKAIKDALKGVDKANAALAKERKAVEKQQDAVNELHAKAEREGDKMAEEYYAGRQVQFKEAARTELLRELVWMHLEVGKTKRDIAVWLDVPMPFVENIRQVMERKKQFRGDEPQRLRIEGNPKLIYQDSGRGGTVWFESRETRFDMWWEFAGGGAFIILEIPTREHWETRTNLPVGRRASVLTFIGEQIVIDHTYGEGSFIIGDSVITFYQGEK